MALKRCGMDFNRLADYVDGRAEEAEKVRVRQHLDAGCADCQRSVAWLERTVGTLRKAQPVSVPEALLVRAQALFRERFPAPHRPSLLAFLQFDSRTTLSLAGARGGGEDPFQLIYSTETHDIDIWEEPTEAGNWYLIGQVLPREGEATLLPQEVVLTAADGSEVSVTPDMPEFHLPSVPPGLYQAMVRLADSEILIPALSVGQVQA